MSRERIKQTAGVPSGLRDGQLGINTSTEELYFKPDSAAQFKISAAAATAWGDITGTLGDQTDLQSALDGKAASSHVHDAADITTGTMAVARLPVMVGDSGSGGTAGIVPAPAIGDATKFLQGDGTWATPSAGSVAWGDITGTLSSQTDLQSALDGKADTSHVHDAADITTGTMAVARLPILVGDSGAGGTAGIVPAPAAGDAADNKFLHADGTWKGTSETINFSTQTSGPYNVVADEEVVICSGTFTVNLPAVASSSGRQIKIINKGTGTITIDGNAAETIDGVATYVSSTQYEAVTLFCDGVEWFAS